MLPVLLCVAHLGIPLSHDLLETSPFYDYILSSRMQCGFQGYCLWLRYSCLLHTVKHMLSMQFLMN